MTWTIEQLNTFIAVTETGSFSAAARKIGKAQSRVSTSMSDLEIDLNLELFDRRGRYPVLTHQGQQLLYYAKQVLDSKNKLDAAVTSILMGEEREFTLAVDEAIPLRVLEKQLIDLDEKFPQLTLSLTHGTQQEIIDFVEAGEADLAMVLQWGQPDHKFSSQAIGFSTMVIAVNAEHPLAKLANFELNDLTQYRQFVVGDRRKESYFPPVSPSYWYVDSYFYALTMVIKSDGWALVPDYLFDDPVFNRQMKQLSAQCLGGKPQMTLSVIEKRIRADGPVRRWLLENLGKAFNH
ncbi:LysR family transcriptional regulator [Paraferrimonas sp. SM1919]|uniref:LysR family transcriptional regulator n=1 Tax=Paraferrimonas sp. SM1919 TaxID=2662263 RepID=UPI0013D5D307|nr:LysR family transcriptional regulator [Paraferrimonas sp. SM1919]